MPEPPARRKPVAAELGARIRAEREKAGVSLRALAHRLGVSPSLLSQLERGLAQPSVATLWGIVTELGLSLDALFADPEGTTTGRPVLVQRAGTRRAIELGGGVRWERLSPVPDPDAAFAFVTYRPGGTTTSDHPPATHRGKEYGYVLTGRLEVEVGDETLELGPGDAVIFRSGTPHRFRAVGDQPAQAVWLNLAGG
ncbi:MAG TPA: XRE family transcriptional regulator [Actinoplanes sp.]|nr:XRE family transcriptional regulator [Actinoplanes sp.]